MGLFDSLFTILHIIITPKLLRSCSEVHTADTLTANLKLKPIYRLSLAAFTQHNSPKIFLISVHEF